MQQILHGLLAVAMTFLLPTVTAAVEPPQQCAGLPSAEQLRGHLSGAADGKGISEALGPGTKVGGLFDGARLWAAVVNRQGALCAVTTSTTDPTQVWPGSQSIAKAKAYTANAFSVDAMPLSTARLYTMTQPGHSLYGLHLSNPFNPQFLSPPGAGDGGMGHVTGGIVTFGGGLPLYAGGKIVGGIGVSGDTSCADHEMAKRVRDLARLNPPDGPLADDIVYAKQDGPSPFAHPICAKTMRNGTGIGDEQP